MATPIRIKRSAVPGKRPTDEQLQVGELALNTYDAELVTLRDRFAQTGIATEVVRVGAGATVTNIITLQTMETTTTQDSNSETQKEASQEQSQSPQQDQLLELVLDLM